MAFDYYEEDERRDLWDYKLPKPYRKSNEEIAKEFNERYGGNQMRTLTGVQCSSKAIRVYFMTGTDIKSVNIIKECRAYCKEHGRYLSESFRKQLKATMPKKLDIWAKYEISKGIEGESKYYCVAEVNEEMLRNIWLNKIKS